jgi:hypothetical protein
MVGVMLGVEVDVLVRVAVAVAVRVDVAVRVAVEVDDAVWVAVAVRVVVASAVPVGVLGVGVFTVPVGVATVPVGVFTVPVAVAVRLTDGVAVIVAPVVGVPVGVRDGPAVADEQADGELAAKSPWLIWFAAALRPTSMYTNGLFGEPVAWQSPTLSFGAALVGLADCWLRDMDTSPTSRAAVDARISRCMAPP